MPNYTVEQALAIQGLNDDAKKYLERLNKSGIDKIKGKIFTATNQQNLKRQIEELVAKKEEERATTLDDCLNVIRSLVKGTKDNRRLISPKELLGKLETLKEEILQEKKFNKIDDMIESSGMTTEQLIEYLQRKPQRR